ncbi:MAG: hypothetical protein AAFY21_06730 [Cyanobacteria bacterium J06641_2]
MGNKLINPSNVHLQLAAIFKFILILAVIILAIKKPDFLEEKPGLLFL